MDFIDEIYEINTVSKMKTYVGELDIEFHLLKTTSEKRKYIKKLKETCFNVLAYIMLDMDLTFVNGNIVTRKYNIVKNKEAFQYFLANYLFGIETTQDFDLIIGFIKEVMSNFKTKNKTARITEEEVELCFKLIMNKFPEFESILNKIEINILLFNASHKLYNSQCTHSVEYNRFQVESFYLKDDNEYNNEGVNPIYVFLHEIGHIVCWLSTRKNNVFPERFIKEATMYSGLTSDNNDAYEVYADSFSIAVLHDSKHSQYNPFQKYYNAHDNEELEKYFKKEIKEINNKLPVNNIKTF